jgi:hypothetical protein
VLLCISDDEKELGNKKMKRVSNRIESWLSDDYGVAKWVNPELIDEAGRLTLNEGLFEWSESS